MAQQRRADFDSRKSSATRAWAGGWRTSCSRSGFTSGKEAWLLVHVEVQGGVEAKFPRRMFQ